MTRHRTNGRGAQPHRTLRSRWAVLAAALAGLWLAGASAAWGAAFQVSPTRFEFSLSQRFTNFFTVTNNADQPVRVRVYAAFVTRRDGELVEVEQHPYDLSQWLVLNPRRLNLRPGQRQVVRFSVRPPGGLAEGEYRAVVFFEELPPPPSESGAAGDTGDVSFQLRLLTRLGITIYGTVGSPSAALTARQTGVEVGERQLRVQGVLRNSGNKHARTELTAVLETTNGLEAQRVNQQVILQRDQEQPFTLELKRPAGGDYRVRFTAAQPDGPVLVNETLPVQVP